MNRFKNILAVFGDAVGSTEVLERAASLAKQNDAILTVLQVIEQSYPSDSIVNERRKQLEHLTLSAREKGLDVRTEVRTGKAFLEITQHVIKNNHDLVITAAEAPGGFRDLLFGSTTFHLMRKCPCPVWVLKPGEGVRFGRILAAVDVHPFNEEENAVTRKILELSTSLAARDEAELHVVHAWDVTGKDRESLESELHDDARNKIIGKHMRAAENRIEGVLAPFREQYEGIQTHVNRGEPWQVVTAMERGLNIDLIVMGTIGQTSIPGFFIGTTAETVLRQVNCSVMAVKPDGFVSPVQVNEHTVYA